MLSGFAALGLATAFTQLIGFAVLVVAARRLGAHGVGAFSFALSLVAYFSIPTNFGVTALGTRDVARDPDQTRALAGEVLSLQSGLVAVPFVALVALAPLIAADGVSRTLLPIVALTFVIDALSLQWVLYGRHRFAAIALSRVLGGVASGALVLALLGPGRNGALELAWFTVVGVAVTSAVTLIAVLRETGLPPLRFDLRRLARRLRASAPLGVAAVMISIYYSIDSVMLGYLKNTGVVGQYAVAYKIPLALITFAALWASVLYPYASDVGPREPERLRGELGLFASLSGVVALPFAVGALITGPALMPELFGVRFAASGTPFVLLTLAAALVMVTINYGTVAVAVGDERRYVVAVTLGAATNLVANFALIPPMGMAGAALATIGAEVVVFIYVYRRMRILLGPIAPPPERLLRAAAATALMAAVLLLAPGDPSAAVRVGIGAVVYVVAAMGLRVVSPRELRMLLAMRGGVDPVVSPDPAGPDTRAL